MNDIRQEIESMYQHHGKAKRCAGAMGVAESTAYRYAQPVNKNGEVIPLLNLMALWDDMKQNGTVDALKAAYRLAQIVVKPLGAVAVDRQMLQACLDGKPIGAYIPPEITELCSHCDEPVRYLPICECRWSRR